MYFVILISVLHRFDYSVFVVLITVHSVFLISVFCCIHYIVVGLCGVVIHITVFHNFLMSFLGYIYF